MNPAPSQNETDTRFEAFVQAFVGKSKNITKAFEYIAADYIVTSHNPHPFQSMSRSTDKSILSRKNHNPAAKNGSASAWSILSPIWQSTPITYLRSTIQGNMSWVNYKAGGIGEVVDRYRWDAGCIAEHVRMPYPENIAFYGS
jgi:hypothetical protein